MHVTIVFVLLMEISFFLTISNLDAWFIIFMIVESKTWNIKYIDGFYKYLNFSYIISYLIRLLIDVIKLNG